ncbi:MAG TPA: ABC transporter permease [Gemmatimonadaceae bacterium]|jgi:predicted permease
MAEPSRVLVGLIRLSLPAEDRDALTAELTALWRARANEISPGAANRWLARQAIGFGVRVGLARLIPDARTLESLIGDARLSLRRMRREPTFVLSFVLTLALATGTLAAVYTAANWLLLRPVPGVSDESNLVTMRLGGSGPHMPARVDWDISQPDVATLRERLPQLTELAAYTPVDVDLFGANGTSGASQRVAAELASGNLFRVLRTAMFAGRGFIAADDSIGAPGVVVLSYDLARSLSSDAASMVGGKVRINGRALVVVGVGTPNFHGAQLPGRAQLWLSAGALSVADPGAQPTALSDGGYAVWHRLVGRLTPNATLAQLSTAANTIVDQQRREHGHSYTSGIQVIQVFAGIGIDPGVRAIVRRTLGLLFGAAMLVLCLAVANLTNLAITRTLSAREVTAVRLALGASQARILRGLLVEMLMLGTAGGIAALAFAELWDRWFQRLQLTEVGGSLQGMHADMRVVAFSMAASVGAATLAFLRPALIARSGRIEQVMRRTRSDGGGATFRTVLVGVQVSLSVVLLVAAMLLSRTVANLRSVDLGFAPDHLLTFAAYPQPHGYDVARTRQLAVDVERKLRAMPSVASAGLVSPVPLESSYSTATVARIDDPKGTDRVIGAGYYVTAGFLPTLGVRVLAGDAAWRVDSGTAVLTRGMLAQLMPGVTPASAIGMNVRSLNGSAVLRIAAVVEDVKLGSLTDAAPPTIFRPLGEGATDEPLTTFMRITDSDSHGALVAARAMATVAPDVPSYNMRSVRDAVDLQFAERRIMATVASTLAALGVVLAAIGLYGVLANVVAAEQREIAIRAALGATPVTILTRVLTRGFVPVVIGAAVGLGGAVGVGRLLASQLYGLGALDPSAYGVGIAATFILALAACLPPAYRATRVSIVAMLRAE